MRQPLYPGLVLAPFVALAILVSFPGHAQEWRYSQRPDDSVCPNDHHAAFHACALEAAKRFDPPRTAAGHPNLQGIWSRRSRGYENLHDHPTTLDDHEAPSMIVSPANGIAPLQPWAEEIRRYNRAAYVHHNAICRLSGVPLTMFMTGTLQFMQTEEYFLVQGEESHSFRMIPVDGRPHIGADIKLWNGDPVGRWEGNTFVVETTNQNARAWLDQRGRFFTDEAHVVERFTMIDLNTIHWEATIEDPNVYTEPMTLALAFRRGTTRELWEEACYENNALASETYRNVGYKIYPGMTGAEARRLRDAWEVEEREQEWRP